MEVRSNALRRLEPDRRLPSKTARPVLALARTPRVAVLLNAHAKRVDRGALRSIGGMVPEADLHLSRDLGEAAQHVRRILEVGYDALLVGGGDGTLAATLNLLVEAERGLGHRGPTPVLGVLRLGTGNALASITRSGRPAADLRRVLSGGRLETVPLRVLEQVDTGEVFPFGSVGYDARMLADFVAVVQATRNAWGKRWAKSVAGYVYALLTRTLPGELREIPPEIRIESRGPAALVDPATGLERPVQPGTVLYEGMARGALFGTTPYYGYGIRALPHASRRADRFHLRVSSASIPHLIARLPGLLRGTVRSPHLVDFLVEDVELVASRPLPLQLSGDVREVTDRFRVRLSPERFRLLRM